jgi:hypothetical protein
MFVAVSAMLSSIASAAAVSFGALTAFSEPFVDLLGSIEFSESDAIAFLAFLVPNVCPRSIRRSLKSYRIDF